MRRKLSNNWKATIYASYAGYITQAIVNSYITLLFVTFQKQYALSLAKITFLITFNFCLQLLIDAFSARFVDRVGYRKCIVAAHICAAAGLAMLGILPNVLPDPYTGILISVIVYAVGGGLIEVLISPIVEACPTDDKTAAMSMLHSFYCWGVVGVIVISTVFFSLAGIEKWYILAVSWAVLPACNAFVFSVVPIGSLTENGAGMSIRKLMKTRIFWVLFLLMICAGASEQAMSQWASAFAESALKVSKTVGDLMGPCMFSICMGIARVIHAKNSHLSLKKYLAFCSILCISGYLISVLSPVPLIGLAGCGVVGFAVGAMWPGSFTLASRSCARGGTAMFALLALGGDLGCSGGPTLTGLVADAFNSSLKAGLTAAVIFPAGMLVGLYLLARVSAPEREPSARN